MNVRPLVRTCARPFVGLNRCPFWCSEDREFFRSDARCFGSSGACAFGCSGAKAPESPWGRTIPWTFQRTIVDRRERQYELPSWPAVQVELPEILRIHLGAHLARRTQAACVQWLLGVSHDQDRRVTEAGLRNARRPTQMPLRGHGAGWRHH
jgi:hypothetical protein